MSQDTFVIADGPGAAVLAAINSATAMLASNSSGTAFPDYLVAGQFIWRTNVPGGGVWTLYAWTGSAGAAILTMDTATGDIAFNNSVFDAAFGSTQGMLLKRGLSAWAGLAVGQAWQSMRVNAAGDDVEYGDQFQKIAADASPASVASFSFTGFPTAIKHARIVLRDVIPATNAQNLKMTVYDSGGSEITTSIHDWANILHYANGGVSGGGSNSAGFAYVGLDILNDILNGADDGGISGTVELFNTRSAHHKFGKWDLTRRSSANFSMRNSGGFIIRSTSVISGVKFAFLSGNISSGGFSAWGSR